MVNVIQLHNAAWQVGILAETGASVAYGRVQVGRTWQDVLRPTPESAYANSSSCASFIMLPWCNRIKDGLLHFEGQTYALRTTKDDGTARHGDVRGRAWRVEERSTAHVRLSLRSSDYADMNWPFAFSAWVTYQLVGTHFRWTLGLKNEDTRRMPAGFGHHPYFVRAGAYPTLEIPCEAAFELVNFMAHAAPVPLPAHLDYRQARALPTSELNDLLTARTGVLAGRLRYADGLTVSLYADAVFQHVLAFAPAGQPFVAVEPMTNASDGFNLYAAGQAGSGVVVLEAGQELVGTVDLALEVDHERA